ncbi:transposase [Streptomyces netropsis]
MLPVLEAFNDGSYLSEIFISGDQSRRDPISVRVVEYTLSRPGDDTVYQLITTICDPVQAPATELAGLYHQRWEIETTLDELKTHQGGPRLVWRSQYPDGIEQEIYGFLLVHHALREVMHHTAHQTGTDPDRLSFIRTLRIARRYVTGQAALPPSRLKTALTYTAHELRERLLPPRRPRSNPRVLKRKMTNSHLKHTHHRNPPQPPTLAITLAAPTKTTRRRNTP